MDLDCQLRACYQSLALAHGHAISEFRATHAELFTHGDFKKFSALFRRAKSARLCQGKYIRRIILVLLILILIGMLIGAKPVQSVEYPKIAARSGLCVTRGTGSSPRPPPRLDVDVR